MQVYRKVLTAIPANLLSDAIASLEPLKQRSRSFIDENGDRKKELVVVDGNPVMAQPGFKDMTTVQAAFDAIKDEKLSMVRLQKQYTYTDIANLSSYAIADAFNGSIDSAIAANDLKAWVGEALTADGLKLDSTLNTKLTSLIGTHGFTADLISDVFAVDEVVEKRFKGLKLGHVQTAIQKRAEGVL